MSKTRHREYMDAILYTKERLIVDSDYSPFMVGRALMKNPRDLLMLNVVNQKGISAQFMHSRDVKEQRIFEKQIHFDFLLHTIKQRHPPLKLSK